MLTSGSGQPEKQFKSAILLSEERRSKTDLIKNPFPFKCFSTTLFIGGVSLSDYQFIYTQI